MYQTTALIARAVIDRHAIGLSLQLFSRINISAKLKRPQVHLALELKSSNFGPCGFLYGIPLELFVHEKTRREHNSARAYNILNDLTLYSVSLRISKALLTITYSCLNTRGGFHHVSLTLHNISGVSARFGD